MKHLVLLLVLAVAGYSIWSVSSRRQRVEASRRATRHGLKLGLIVLILLALLVIAYFIPSIQLL